MFNVIKYRSLESSARGKMSDFEKGKPLGAMTVLRVLLYAQIKSEIIYFTVSQEVHE